MYEIGLLIGEHVVRTSTRSWDILDWLSRNFRAIAEQPVCDADLTVSIDNSYGQPFQSFDVHISSDETTTTYRRTDYFLQMDRAHRRARIAVHDTFALKHALMNLYSAFVVHHEWGMLVHSSCVAQRGQAYLFAGQSGAGKSTVALLSRPRRVLSDEATVLKISSGQAVVFDSPFRSDSSPVFDPDPYPVRGVHILRQSQSVARWQMSRSEGIVELMSKVFFWSHDPKETVKILTLHRHLADCVPIYRLDFQKNDSFWEAIS